MQYFTWLDHKQFTIHMSKPTIKHQLARWLVIWSHRRWIITWSFQMCFVEVGRLALIICQFWSSIIFKLSNPACHFLQNLTRNNPWAREMSLCDCPLCFSPYSFATSHRPTTMSCGHSVCLECIPKLKNVCGTCNMKFTNYVPNYLWCDIAVAFSATSSQVRHCDTSFETGWCKSQVDP